MRFVYGFLFLVALCGAQTIGLTGGATVRPGGSASVNVVLSNSNGPGGLQWTLPTPPGWTVTRTAGPAATAANKDLSCGDTGICLVFGLNRTSIQSGTIATYQFTVPASSAPSSVSLALSGVQAATGSGALVQMGVGPPHEIRVLARSDIDGDGSTTITDVQAMASQVTGVASCVNDQNADGKCDLIDVLLVVLAAIGG